MNRVNKFQSGGITEGKEKRESEYEDSPDSSTAKESNQKIFDKFFSDDYYERLSEQHSEYNDQKEDFDELVNNVKVYEDDLSDEDMSGYTKTRANYIVIDPSVDVEGKTKYHEGSHYIRFNIGDNIFETTLNNKELNLLEEAYPDLKEFKDELPAVNTEIRYRIYNKFKNRIHNSDDLDNAIDSIPNKDLLNILMDTLYLNEESYTDDNGNIDSKKLDDVRIAAKEVAQVIPVENDNTQLT